jgi:hypothetical protein
MTLTDLLTKEVTSDRTANEVINQTMGDLNLLPQDILHLTAEYINYNISKRNAKYKEKTKLLDMNTYSSKNYSKNEWDNYINELSLTDRVKLDFQILLYAITSEKMLREYYYKTNIGKNGGNKRLAEQMSNPKGPWSHQDLAISFAEQFSGALDRPNGNAFKGHLTSDYTTNLDEQVKKGIDDKVIINDLLNNFDQYFILNEGYF